jgi:putative ABC transport system permease protein
VNRSFARRYFSGDPLGRNIMIRELVSGKLAYGNFVPWKIVGLVADVKFSGLNDAAVPVIYVPMQQSPWPGGALLLRTLTDPAPVGTEVVAKLHRLSADTPVTSIKSMNEVASESLSQRRIEAWLLAAFSSLALLMAALGVFGLVSYSVAQRTPEFGIRIALGARTGDVLALVLKQVIILIGTGLLLGMALGSAVSRALSPLLYGVSASDLTTFAAVSVVMVLVGALAALIPAVRAIRIHPLDALRFE